MVGVFNRYSPLVGSHESGYSTILVRCKNTDQLNAVRHSLGIHDFVGLKKTKGAWRFDQGFLGVTYGGRFDLVYVSDNDMPEPAKRYQVIDDDRYIGVFDGTEILEELNNANE